MLRSVANLNNASQLTGNTLAPNITASSLTSVGTLTALTVAGTVTSTTSAAAFNINPGNNNQSYYKVTQTQNSMELGLFPSGITYLSSNGNYDIQFYRNGANVGTFTSSGLSVTGAIDISASTAGQIKFPSSPNLSSNANTLDDYAEGTWTPTVAFGGAAVGLTYGTQVGNYTKVGNLVTIVCRLALTAVGSSTGTATIGGLPFAFGSSAINYGFTAVAHYDNMASLTGGVLLRGAPSGSVLTVYTNSSAVNSAACSQGNFTATTNMHFSMTYMVGL